MRILAITLAVITVSGCTSEQLANFREGYAEYAAAHPAPQQIIIEQPDNTGDVYRSIPESRAARDAAVSRSLSNDTSAAIIGRGLY